MKRTYFALLFILSLTTPAWANQRTVSDAEAIARQVLQDGVIAKSHSLKGSIKEMKTIRSSYILNRTDIIESHEAFYVFKPDNQGYVLVSADDRMPDVLAFSEEDVFNENDIPSNMAAMLQSYADAFVAIEKGATDAESVFFSRNSNEITVEPLLGDIKYDQEKPYNTQCPICPSSGTQAPAGCVATAMAQIMRYYKWPQDYCKGSVEYTSISKSDTIEISCDFSKVKFDWDNMQDDYSHGYTQASADAVAQLLAICGASVEMNYSPNYSSTFSMTHIVSGGNKYFGYDSDASCLSLEDMNPDTWHKSIQKELIASRPILYSGYDKNSEGHVFVLDGIKYENSIPYYHVNWGWSGEYNGYFLLTLLKPYEGGSNYANSNSMILGFQPDDGTSKHNLAYRKITTGNIWVMPEDEISVTIEGIKNLSAASFSGTINMCLKDTAGIIYDFGQPVPVNELKYMSYLPSQTITFSLPAIPTGDYTLTMNIKATDYGECQIYNADETTTIHVVELKGVLRYFFNEKEKTAKVRRFFSNAERNAAIYCNDIIIPDSFDCNGIKYKVTAIDDYAFQGCTNLTSITVPNSVTTIGLYAFDGCNSLTSAIIPSSVETIGDRAFWNCNALKSVSLNSNTIASSGRIYSIFGSQITSCVIGNNVKTIGSSLFSGCISLVSVILPNSVTSIGDNAFADCHALKTINIPNSVTSIKNNTFSGCYSLTQVFIPNSVVDIGNYVFSGCISLTSLDIPNSVVNIGNYTFQNCGLTSVTIPNSVTSIGNYAFYGCRYLTSIDIPNSVTTIGKGSFAYTYLQSITIPTSVISIGNCAFQNCVGLTSVFIPHSVTSIGEFTFSGCSGLTSVEIPNSVTDIGNNAFENCRGLTAITLPNSLTNIGDQTFSGCDALTSVDIPNSVAKIGRYAFYRCYKLTSITIPLSVTHIGDYAFSGCSALKSIVSKITEPFDIIDNVFENLYTKAQLTVPQGCIDKYKKAKGWKNFKYIAEGPEGIRLITVKQNSDAIWYNLQGRKVSTPEKGISIIRYKDGTTKKVMK